MASAPYDTRCDGLQEFVPAFHAVMRHSLANSETRKLLGETVPRLPEILIAECHRFARSPDQLFGATSPTSNVAGEAELDECASLMSLRRSGRMDSVAVQACLLDGQCSQIQH